MAVGILGLSPEARASITFSGTFTSPNPGVVDPAPFNFTRGYSNPSGTLVFTTQGFNSGGLGTGGTGGVGAANSNPHLLIMTDSTACAAAWGAPVPPGMGRTIWLRLIASR